LLNKVESQLIPALCLLVFSKISIETREIIGVDN